MKYIKTYETFINETYQVDTSSKQSYNVASSSNQPYSDVLTNGDVSGNSEIEPWNYNVKTVPLQKDNKRREREKKIRRRKNSLDRYNDRVTKISKSNKMVDDIAVYGDVPFSLPSHKPGIAG